MITRLHLTIVFIAIKLFGLGIQIIGGLYHNFVTIFVSRLDTEPLATYPEIFAVKCKRSNELWLFEAAFKVWSPLQ